MDRGGDFGGDEGLGEGLDIKEMDDEFGDDDMRVGAQAEVILPVIRDDRDSLFPIFFRPTWQEEADREPLKCTLSAVFHITSINFPCKKLS